MATAYYNEIDPFAAAWLRELIAGGHIAPGVVDERSIEDVRPDELAGFTQCHFFAGIGVHSLALRRAGWPDDRPIWTGSCPCQPFSAAGKGEGFTDERHLWPAFFHLIEQCEPAIVAGEQVASSGTGIWFDLVQADLEAMGYAFGLVPLPAAGFGGAHIRDRAFWLADATGSGQSRQSGSGLAQEQRVAELRGTGRMADTGRGLLQYQQQLGSDGSPARTTEGEARQLEWGGIGHSDGGIACGMADAAGDRWGQGCSHGGGSHVGTLPREAVLPAGLVSHSNANAPMLGRDAADWLFCRDGKWRPVEPGTFPLAHEAPGGMVPLCPDCRNKKGPLNVSLHKLLEIADRHEGRQSSEILLDGVPVAAQDEAADEPEHRAPASAAYDARRPLPEMRFVREFASTPRGSESTQQRTGEYRGSLRDVPPRGAQARTAAIDLRGLWDKVHRSFASKSEQDSQCAVCGGMGPPVRLTKVGQSRVGELRGYGNAIDAETLTQFYAAVIGHLYGAPLLEAA